MNLRSYFPCKDKWYNGKLLEVIGERFEAGFKIGTISEFVIDDIKEFLIELEKKDRMDALDCFKSYYREYYEVGYGHETSFEKLNFTQTDKVLVSILEWINNEKETIIKELKYLPIC